MKRFPLILCILASLQVPISCSPSPMLLNEIAFDGLAAVKIEQPVPSRSVEVQNLVANFVRELINDRVPESGSKLTCREFESSLEVLSFVCSSLLLHPAKGDFPYNSSKECYDYRSQCLQLQFREQGLGAGEIARIDIWFLKACGGVKAGARYTICFRKPNA